MLSGIVPVGEPKFQISDKKILLVEGRDDQAVFNALCEKMGVCGVQVIRYGGKHNLRNFVADLTFLDGFSDVVSIGLTIDVDTNPRSARDRVKGALENASLPVPDEPLSIAEGSESTKVAYLLVPHQSDRGELEDVCLQAIENEATLRCIESFMGCVEQHRESIVEPSKSRLQAYLSTHPDPDKRIGEAVMAGYLPYDAEAFAPLRTLIEML